MKRFISCIIVFLFFPGVCWSQSLNDRLSFIGLDDEDRWQIYLVNKTIHIPEVIKTEVEPRNHAVNIQTSKICYIGSDGALREFRLKDQSGEKILFSPSIDKAYAQPIYSKDGRQLFFVELKKGSSVDTDIWVLESDKKIPRNIVSQRSAQFEPYYHSDNFLYYSSVHCTSGCGKLIQEIWRKHLVSGEAEQVTMVNNIAHQPSISHDGNWLYFSSDKSGNNHIWRFSLSSKTYEQLTSGDVSDINPFADEYGNLYFIRHTVNGTRLMVKYLNDMETIINLPGNIKEIRDLKIN